MQRSTERWPHLAVALISAALAACSASLPPPQVLPERPVNHPAVPSRPGPVPSVSAPPAPITSAASPAATTTAASPPTPADPSPRVSVASPSVAASPAERRENATADAALELLAYHERVREMSAAELAREVARLGDPPASPRAALALAIVLAQTHGPGDLLRALALIEPIARATHPAALPWQPFARWLAVRYAEQRRLEDQLERLAQQLREQQRRLDQLTEKLAALRAIERSLGRGPSGGSPRPPSSGASR